MITFRSILFAAVCLAVLFLPSAPAQTQPFTIITYSGNGQMVCAGCPFWAYQYFDPIVAQVLDATGAPVVGASVTWYLTEGGTLSNTGTSITDQNGQTSNNFQAGVISGSAATPFMPYQVVATIGTSSAIFYETQALAVNGSVIWASVDPYNSSIPTSISGAAGTTASPIQIYAHAYGQNIQGVEVRLINNQTSPTVTCAADSTGGDPGTTLSLSNGIATCNPVLAGSGTGTFSVLVGGVAVWSASTDTPAGPAGFRAFNNIGLTVTAPTPASIQVTGGNSQTATAGQALSSPLVALIKDTNGNVLASQSVTWSVSPSSAGTFTNTVNSSTSTGVVQTGFTFSSTASGTVTVTVAVTGNSSIKTTFSLTAIPLVSVGTLTKSSGDGQITTSGQAFANPLVVYVTNTSGSAASGVAVTFSASGSATLNTSTPTTGSNGLAQVYVTAPTVSSQTSITVTAQVSGLSVSFSLTVNPAGPTITSFVNAADLKTGSLSPCSLATVYGSGIAPSLSGTTVGAYFGPGPYTLAGASLTVSGTQAPIFSIANNGGTQSLTFQVPCEVTALTNATVAVSVNGGSATVTVPVYAASPGVYGALGSDNVTRATLVRQDGSFVSLSNPARRGDTVTAFVTGLGPTTPTVGTNSVPPRGTTATVNGTVIPGIGVGGVATLNYARLTSDLVGVYEVSFTIPSTVSTGNSIGFSVGLIPAGASSGQYGNLVYIPIQ